MLNKKPVKEKLKPIIYQLEQAQKITKIHKAKLKMDDGSASLIDDLIDDLKEINDALYDLEYYEFGDKAFMNDYDFRIDTVDEIMDMFKEQQLPIDYDDYESIDYFMANIKTCFKYAYVDLTYNYIDEWTKELELIFCNYVLELIENLIIDLNNSQPESISL